MKLNAPDIASDVQDALTRIAHISFNMPLALAAVDRISDYVVLAELALSDLEIAESAARRLEPARNAGDREALVRIAVEAAHTGVLKGTVQVLGRRAPGLTCLYESS